ncbi:MAG: hypothetical protein NZ923_08675 [Candidatus Kryptonium sp.]|nr:hypothetical protein [Candidatus Kryptonium sp.]
MLRVCQVGVEVSFRCGSSVKDGKFKMFNGIPFASERCFLAMDERSKEFKLIFFFVFFNF